MHCAKLVGLALVLVVVEAVLALGRTRMLSIDADRADRVVEHCLDGEDEHSDREGEHCTDREE